MKQKKETKSWLKLLYSHDIGVANYHAQKYCKTFDSS